MAGAFLLIAAFFILASLPAPNYDFLYAGVLSAFLGAIELVTRFSRTSQWSDVSWQTRKQVSTHKFGLFIMLVGFVLAFYGLFELNNTLVPCLPSGCGGGFSGILGEYRILFYAGLAAIAAGRVMIFLTKFMSGKTEKWREQLMTTRKV